MKKLDYSLDSEVVNYLLQVLGNTQFRGIEQAEMMLRVKTILQSPSNQEELEKEQLENLKTKYEKSTTSKS